MIKNIPSFKSELTEDMKEAALTALQNEKFVMGESVNKFEEEFAEYVGTKYSIAVNSGSSALYLSLLGLNITKNSTVITSTNSFVASANSIVMTGAKPILCDIYESYQFYPWNVAVQGGIGMTLKLKGVQVIKYFPYEAELKTYGFEPDPDAMPEMPQDTQPTNHDDIPF